MTTDLNVKDRDDKSINVEIDVSSVSFFLSSDLTVFPTITIFLFNSWQLRLGNGGTTFIFFSRFRPLGWPFLCPCFEKASGEDTFLFFLSVESQGKEEKFNYSLEKKGILVLPTFFSPPQGCKNEKRKREREKKEPPPLFWLCNRGWSSPPPSPLQFQNWPVEGTEAGSLAFLYYNSTWLGWWSEKIFLKTLFGGKKGGGGGTKMWNSRMEGKGEREFLEFLWRQPLWLVHGKD